jgi:hypothetical protein
MIKISKFEVLCITSLTQCLIRLKKDHSLIVKTFYSQTNIDSGMAGKFIVKNISKELGDMHKPSSGVRIIEYEGLNQKFKVVYKPSTIFVDYIISGNLKLFSQINSNLYNDLSYDQSFVEIMNEKIGEEYRIPTYLILPMEKIVQINPVDNNYDDVIKEKINDSYGYIEFIESAYDAYLKKYIEDFKSDFEIKSINELKEKYLFLTKLRGGKNYINILNPDDDEKLRKQYCIVNQYNYHLHMKDGHEKNFIITKDLKIAMIDQENSLIPLKSEYLYWINLFYKKKEFL